MDLGKLTQDGSDTAANLEHPIRRAWHKAVENQIPEKIRLPD